jgi:arsenate reductase
MEREPLELKLLERKPVEQKPVEHKPIEHKPKILFFSTGNATRSRMAKAFFRRLSGDDIVGESTAVHSPEANALAVEVMSEVGIDMTQENAKPLAQSFHENFACVITLSDDTKERSPVWPFTRNLVHWNLTDPTASDEPLEQRKQSFRRLRDEIQNKVSDFTRELAPKLKLKARAMSNGK